MTNKSMTSFYRPILYNDKNNVHAAIVFFLNIPNKKEIDKRNNYKHDVIVWKSLPV